MLQGEHSAILLTFIKLPFVIKIFVCLFLSGGFTQILLYVDFYFSYKLAFVNSLQKMENNGYLIFWYSSHLLAAMAQMTLHIHAGTSEPFAALIHTMGLDARKPVFRVSDKVSFKPVSSATETC